MNMEALSSVPKDLPPFSLLSNEQIANWLLKQVDVVMDCLQLNNFSSLNFLHDEISKLDKDESVLNSMMSESGYACAVCGKTYSRAAWLKKHLQKKHTFVFSDSETCKLKVNPLHSFLQMSCFLEIPLIPTKWEMATGLLGMRTLNGYMPHPFTILSILSGCGE